MSIFVSFYYKATARRFRKAFNPLGMGKRVTMLISTPRDPREFLKALPFIAAVRKIASLVMLIHQDLAPLYTLLKPRLGEVVSYIDPLNLFTKEQTRIETHLAKKSFHFLIELDDPVHKVLPYMVPVQKRICFFNNQNYPYFNIMMKDGYRSLHSFFNIEPHNPKELFTISKRDKKTVLKRYNKKNPLLVVNNKQNVVWEGDSIVVEHDISASDPELYKIVYYADAYTGRQDSLYEFANIFKKEIIE